MTARTLLIGLDGATFTVLDPLMERGIMPFLRDFADRGVRAPLRSIVPALTPPAWTTVMTGKRPGQHGVFDFFQKEGVESEHVRFASSHDIGTETIWGIASRHDRRVIALNFPLMFPPPAVNGCVVPGGWMPWRQLRLGCYPSGLFDRLKALPSFEARELALDMAMEEKAIEGCAAEEYQGWIALHLRRERRWLDVLTFLMREEPAELTAILFDGVDKLQHLCWRFLDPAFQPEPSTPWDQKIRALCEDYFRKLDGIIAEIVGLAGPDTSVVMVSDHGFGAATDMFYVNTWLEQQGYLRWASDDGPADAAPKVGFGQIARHVYQLDWEHTRAYAATPTSHGIFIVRERSGWPGGVAPADYARVRQAIAEGLLRLRHPDTGHPVVTAITTREEGFAGPYEELAPDLTLTLAEGGLMSILRSATSVRRRADVSGTHRPIGVMLAGGPGIRPAATLSELSLIDVAPLLLYLADLPVPTDMAGRVPVEALEPSRLARQPLRSVAPKAANGTTGSVSLESEFDAEADETMLKRLRALGYVE